MIHILTSECAFSQPNTLPPKLLEWQSQLFCVYCIPKTIWVSDQTMNVTQKFRITDLFHGLEVLNNLGQSTFGFNYEHLKSSDTSIVGKLLPLHENYISESGHYEGILKRTACPNIYPSPPFTDAHVIHTHSMNFIHTNNKYRLSQLLNNTNGRLGLQLDSDRDLKTWRCIYCGYK